MEGINGLEYHRIERKTLFGSYNSKRKGKITGLAGKGFTLGNGLVD
jgi:hypothetical protein